MDPRHRLVTTKYNPARTWTPENAVGIGGAYMCIYGMEGPGGYQFVGRTLPVWNRHRRNNMFVQPYLLRLFDQIRYYEVSPSELMDMRSDFRAGKMEIKIEETSIELSKVQTFLESIDTEAKAFKAKQSQAFEKEKQQWIRDGQFSFDAALTSSEGEQQPIPQDATPISAPISGAVWKCPAGEGDTVTEDQTIIILEAMKMEMSVCAPCDGKVGKIFVQSGQTVEAGQCLGYMI
jgi:urea carboxylase